MCKFCISLKDEYFMHIFKLLMMAVPLMIWRSLSHGCITILAVKNLGGQPNDTVMVGL
jgi:hypothetical protein